MKVNQKQKMNRIKSNNKMSKNQEVRTKKNL